MFKFKSYNVKKESEKNEKSKGTSSSTTSSSSSSLTGTLRKNPKEKTKPSAEQTKHVNNKSSPEYTKKNKGKTVEWHENKTFSTKSETKKVVIPSPHKKLERK